MGLLASHLPAPLHGGLGMAGAALATVLAQCLAASIALGRVKARANRHRLVAAATPAAAAAAAPRGLAGWQGAAARFVATASAVGSAGGAMLVRTTSILAYWALATALAARLGSAAVAAHHVALQVSVRLY
jgi:Na+-driven multidrug efflux pump